MKRHETVFGAMFGLCWGWQRHGWSFVSSFLVGWVNPLIWPKYLEIKLPISEILITTGLSFLINTCFFLTTNLLLMLLLGASSRWSIEIWIVNGNVLIPESRSFWNMMIMSQDISSVSRFGKEHTKLCKRRMILICSQCSITLHCFQEELDLVESACQDYSNYARSLFQRLQVTQYKVQFFLHMSAVKLDTVCTRNSYHRILLCLCTLILSLFFLSLLSLFVIVFVPCSFSYCYFLHRFPASIVPDELREAEEKCPDIGCSSYVFSLLLYQLV